MSEHVIEDLIAESITLLHEHDTGADHRDLIHALLAFQRTHDCSFTHGRMLGALVEGKFTYVLPMTAHPAFEKDRFVAPNEAITFVSELFDHEGDEGDDDDDEQRRVGNEQGYLFEGKLYCDAGTPLWNALVAAKVLNGPDAQPPNPVTLGAVAHRVCVVAERIGDRDTIGNWINIGPNTLFARSKLVKKGSSFGINPFTGKQVIAQRDVMKLVAPTVEELAANLEAMALRDLAKRTPPVEVVYERPPEEHWSEAEQWFWGR